MKAISPKLQELWITSRIKRDEDKREIELVHTWSMFVLKCFLGGIIIFVLLSIGR